MSRQHSTPYIVSRDKTYQLKAVSGIFDENWLQKFLFVHHQAIPIDEIEPAFGPLIPVCRELPTKAGPIDALFINSNGLLTLVECKLWKNPEARREVVGQILDYAKELSQWSYEDLQKAIGAAQVATKTSLYKLVTLNAEDIDEQEFIDNVARNLRRGRFLLLILGDGIRENVEQLADFLQKYAHLNFSFALVEFGIFSLPDQSPTEYFIQPRVVTQTIELERAVFRIEDNQIVPTAPPENKIVPKRAKISEQVFFEKLNVEPSAKSQLKTFFEKAVSLGLYLKPGQDSMKMKSSLDDSNFGVFKINGEFYNCGIASTTDELGQPQIGEEYLDRLARLLNSGFVKRGESRFWWSVKIKEKKGDRYARVAEMMAIQEQWLKLIQTTLDQISQLGSQ